jgi:hypothetical protein
MSCVYWILPSSYSTNNILQYISHLKGFRSGEDLNPYLVSTHFESHPRHRFSWIKFSWLFLVPPGKWHDIISNGQRPLSSRYFPIHSTVYNLSTEAKVKFSLYRPWRPLWLREVEAPTFSDVWLTDGGKVVSPMRRPLFTPRKIPGTHFC